MPAPSTLETFLRAFTFRHVAPPARCAARRGAGVRLAGWCRAWRRAGSDRRRQFRRRGGARLKQGGGLRVHKGVGVSPDPGHPRGHRERCCISACARDLPTLRRGCSGSPTTDRPRHSRRRHRGHATQGRLGVLEHEGVQAAGERRLRRPRTDTLWSVITNGVVKGGRPSAGEGLSTLRLADQVSAPADAEDVLPWPQGGPGDPHVRV